MNEEDLNKKLKNPINIFRLQRMITKKFPEEDRLKVIRAKGNIKYDELSEEAQEIYNKTMKKILGK